MPVISSSTNAVEKTCRILCALSDTRTRRLKEIAAATGLNKVSVLRILETLVAEGLVVRNDETREYGYGTEIHVMASAPGVGSDLRSVASTSVARLAQRSGDTALLVARTAGLDCVCLERETGDFPVHASTLYVGSRRPLGVGSGPTAILSWLDEQEQARVMEQLRSRLKPYPRLTLARIRQSVQETQDRGCAVQYDEIVSQVGAIGMVIPDASGRPIGALSISSLSNRIRAREDYLMELLSNEVTSIRSALRNPHPRADAASPASR
jgi:DNA-binding IclR family transcriptional regulator